MPHASFPQAPGSEECSYSVFLVLRPQWLLNVLLLTKLEGTSVQDFLPLLFVHPVLTYESGFAWVYVGKDPGLCKPGVYLRSLFLLP